MVDQPRWNRRSVLRSGAAALGGAGVGWSAAAVVVPDGSGAAPVASASYSPAVGGRIVPFAGAHQAGISTAAQAHLSLIGLDLREGVGTGALHRMMRLLSDDVERLSRGVPALADLEPELTTDPASLSVTFGFGPRVVAHHSRADIALEPLPSFSIDRFEEPWDQTDLAMQICCDDPITLAHARRMLLKDARAFATVRWVQDGFRRSPGVEDGATMRNLLGQVDGTANPAAADPDYDSLIWSDRDGFDGGTFMVVRRIRMELDAWDKVDRGGRENALGRRLDNGAPLTGTREFDAPDFEATDDLGFKVIDPASHVARAHSADGTQRFLRRGYNYVVPDPGRSTGEDTGLVFVAFAADLESQFIPVQRRLADSDRMNQWITPIGSAVYAVPPGASAGGYVAESFLS